MAPEAPDVSAWETKWLRETSATLNPSTAMEFPEPPRRNSPSDPTSREIEDHVLTGHASFPVVVSSVCASARSRLRDTTGNLKTAQRSHVVDYCFLEAKNRTNEVRGRTTWRQSCSGGARWSHQVNFCSIASPERL